MKVIRNFLAIIGGIVIIIMAICALTDTPISIGHRKQSPNSEIKPGTPTKTVSIPSREADDLSTQPVPTEEQKRQAIAVKNWLKEKGVSIQKSDNEFIINGIEEGVLSIEVSGDPSYSSSPIYISTDGKGNLVVAIDHVGSAVFKVDTAGNLRPLWEEDTPEQGVMDLSEIIEKTPHRPLRDIEDVIETK